MLRSMTLVLASICFLSITPAAFPHSGGLDANGGHYNRKTGVYHVHRPRSKPASKPQPVEASSFSSRYSQSKKSTRKVPARKAQPVKPKGRIWHGHTGKRLAKGNPKSFNKKTCRISLDDGVHVDLSISLEDLSVVDMAYTLNGFKRNSHYYSHSMKWVSKSGSFTVRATPLIVDDNSILLLKSDRRIVDVALKQLNESSRQLAIDLRQAGVAAKSLVDSIELNPFDGGVVTGEGSAATMKTAKSR